MYGIIYTLPVSRKRGTPLQPPFSPTHPHPSSDMNDPFLISGVDNYYPHTSITQPPVFWHHRLPLGALPRGRLLTPADEDEDDDEVFVTVGFRVSDTHFFWTPFHRMPLGARPRGRVASRGFCDWECDWGGDCILLFPSFLPSVVSSQGWSNPSLESPVSESSITY